MENITINLKNISAEDKASIMKIVKKSETPKRWRAERDSCYYFVDNGGQVARTVECGTVGDDFRFDTGNYFETEKPYLNPRLTITEVALYLYSNKTYLSRLINDHYNNNFSQFVNYYRIQVAKELFLKDNRMTIHQLCDLSGFGSMATFTMAFRLNVGNSPAEWCKEQKIKRQNDNQEEEN